MGGMPVTQEEETILIFTRILNEEGDAIEEATYETIIKND